MKLLSLLLVIICLINFINADVYSNVLDFGGVAKGKLITQKYVNIGLPTSTFNLEGIQVVILNKTSNEPFPHAYLSTCSIDFTIYGKKIVSFTASNIANQLNFPSPYVVPVTGNVNLTISMYTLNKVEQNISIAYYMKWDNAGSNTFVKLTRTATSVVANFSSFTVPAGSGSGFTIQNSMVWGSNAEAMNFQATVSPGILSMSFIESLNGENTVICQSTPTYNGHYLVKMSGCDNVVSLYKGATYITQAVYNNTVELKNVFGTLGVYVGYPAPTTTTTGGSSTHSSTTNPSTTGGSSASSSGPSTTGGSSSHGSSSGPSSSGPSSSGPSSSSSTQTSGSHSNSESGSDSFTTTTAGSSEIPDSSDNQYTSGTSGSSGAFVWNGNQGKRVVEIY